MSIETGEPRGRLRFRARHAIGRSAHPIIQALPAPAPAVGPGVTLKFRHNVSNLPPELRHGVADRLEHQLARFQGRATIDVTAGPHHCRVDAGHGDPAEQTDRFVTRIWAPELTRTPSARSTRPAATSREDRSRSPSSEGGRRASRTLRHPCGRLSPVWLPRRASTASFRSGRRPSRPCPTRSAARSSPPGAGWLSPERRGRFRSTPT